MIINFYRSINENIDPTYPRSRHANMKNNKLCKRDNIFNFGKGNSIETDMYIIWTIMYDYKLANIPRIIGVMRSRLTDNTLKAAESRLSGPPLPRRQSLRALVTSPRREECTEAESSVLSSIPDSISKRRIPSFLEESPYRNLNSIFARSRFIYERDRRPAFPPCLGGRKLREHVQLNK